MDTFSPYDFHKYVYSARYTIAIVSCFECLMVLFGLLTECSMLVKLVEFFALWSCVAVTAHNISFRVDARHEIRNIIVEAASAEASGKSAALVLVPPVTGLIAFFGVTGHLVFSTLALIHVIVAVGQLGIEVYETNNNTTTTNCADNSSSCRTARGAPTPPPPPPPITAPTDRKTVAAHDPQYQTLTSIHNDIFDKKQ